MIADVHNDQHVLDRIALITPHILSEIETPHGRGTLLGVNIPFNGLYFEPHKAEWQVWYSTENAQSGFVSFTYTTEQLLRVWEKGHG